LHPFAIEKTADTAHIWFWPFVKVGNPDECWPWTGARFTHGYGRVRRIFGRAQMTTHRLAFFLAHGRWPEPVARHTCDNKTCCNPAHLIEGTIGDNVRDAVERGLIRRGERAAGAKLTAKQVTSIRKSKLPHTTLGQRFGVHDTTIIRIRRHETWAG
jgi:hypothetical protein